MKKLTILIPCYNVEKYIEKALESIIIQDNFQEFCDVVIIDDGSIDKTTNIVNDFIEKNKLTNFKLIKKSNSNWGGVINYAKNNNLLKNQYTTILDADDYYKKGLFNVIDEHIEKQYDLIFTGFYEIKKHNKIINGYLLPIRGNKSIKKEYMRFPSLIPLCKFFKTELFVKLNDLKENVSYQDVILWNKFVDIANSFYYIKKPYGYYLNHREGASSTVPFDEKRINEILEIVEKLTSNDKNTNGYLMALLFHLKINTPKENRKYLIFKNYNQLKKFKLLWCPFGTRTLTRLGIIIYLRGLFKK